MSSWQSAEIDLVRPDDSCAMVVARVPARSDVLDISTSERRVATVLAAMGCRVWAVAREQGAPGNARAYEDVVVGDVETMNLPKALGDRRFDVVLCLDILDRLRDPSAVLTKVRQLLTPRGWVILSVPNVGHPGADWSERPPSRLFDREAVTGLVTAAGMSILDMDRVRAPVGSTEIAVDGTDPVVAEQLVADPEAETHQLVIMAAPDGSSLVTDPPVLMARDLQRRVHELESELDRAATDERAWWEANLAALQEASHQREQMLRTLLVELRAGADSVRASWPEANPPPPT